jgi:hypothetical protein
VVTLAWDPNPESDIAGYMLSYGTTSHQYSSTIDVGNITIFAFAIPDPTMGYYFAVRAYNTRGAVSGFSNEVSAPVAQTPIAPAANSPRDFSGDGKPDLIWQNAATRQAGVWYMAGAGGNLVQGSSWLSEAGIPGWTLAGAGDFNGDGKPDLVWQSDGSHQVVVWYMGGAQGNIFLWQSWLSAGELPDWRVVGIGDMNGDGKPDLIWQNDATRQVIVGYLDGSLRWDWLSSTEVAGWSVVGLADFNRDGRLDLVCQNDLSRQIVVWYGGSQDWNWLASDGVAGWRVAGTGDFNGDGSPDLLLQSDSMESVVIWYLGGSQGNIVQGWNGISSSVEPGWLAIAR